MTATASELAQLASLLRERNSVDAKIARLIGRPAFPGHIGEFVAARVFDVDLHRSAVVRGSDGTFRGGPYTGQSVNIKLYTTHTGMLDVCIDGPPDVYLVLVGPKETSASSRGKHRPLVIADVLLLRHEELIARNVRPGIAASVRNAIWDRARVFPSECAGYPLTSEQRELLALFRPEPS